MAYDQVYQSMLAAAARLNDDIETNQPETGSILEVSEFFTQTVVNQAWQRLQELLVSLGYMTLKNETVLANLAPYEGTDPSAQPYITWSAFFDGALSHSTPVLPANLIAPIEVQERVTGQAPGTFFTMDLIRGPIPAVPKTWNNRSWQWRNDALYLGGCTQSFDLRIIYAQYFNDFVDGASPWFYSQVPIMRSREALANYICSEYMMVQGKRDEAIVYSASAENAAQIIVGKDTAAISMVPKESQAGSGKMRDRYQRQGAIE